MTRPARGLFVTAALLAGYGAAGLYRATVERAGKHIETMQALSLEPSEAWRNVDISLPLLGTAAMAARSNVLAVARALPPALALLLFAI